jgi:asparagine synthase (glutamine-hydrolysing)
MASSARHPRFAGLFGREVLEAPDVAFGRCRAALAGDETCEILVIDSVCIANSGPVALYEHASRLTILFGGRGPEDVQAHTIGDWPFFAGASLRTLPTGFAFLVWERDRRRGLVAVDPLGVQSVFVFQAADYVAFASDVAELLRLLPSRPEPDTTGVAQWLVQGQLERGRTLYRGVRRLSGGHALDLTPGGVERAYWQPSYESPLGIPRTELVGELRGGMRRAVGRRLPGRGASGVMLSGGLDSSAVASVVAEADPAATTYSGVFPSYADIDESTYIESVVNHTMLRSVRIPLGEGSPLAPSLEFLSRFELPPFSPNLFLTLPIMQRAEGDGVIVLFDGEGGDELFGRPRFLLADRVRRLRYRSARELVGGLHHIAERPDLHRAAFHYWGIRGALPYWAHRLVRVARPTLDAPSWLTPGAAAALGASADAWAWKRRSGPRWWAHQVDILTLSREQMGVHDELRRRGELVGLECAHPLLDDLDFVELALRMPPEQLFDPLYDRPLLREALVGLVPDDVRLRRNKHHFTRIYMDRVVDTDWPAVERLLHHGTPEVAAFVRPEALRDHFLGAAPEQRLRAWGVWFWRLLVAECWLRMQSDVGFPLQLREELSAGAI